MSGPGWRWVSNNLIRTGNPTGVMNDQDILLPGGSTVLASFHGQQSADTPGKVLAGVLQNPVNLFKQLPNKLT
ncbi:MAG: hypothetical protein ABW019_09150 [Chitinophagaceae bacterium]